MFFALDRFDSMPSVLVVIFATLGIVFLIAGLALLVFAGLLGLVVLFLAFILFFLSFAIARTPNFAAIYDSPSGRRAQRYLGNSSGFQRPMGMGGYQNVFQGQSIGAQRAGVRGINQPRTQNKSGLGWILIVVGAAFFVAGLLGSVISFVYGVIFLYAGVKALASPMAGLSYGQVGMNIAPPISAGNQSDGFD